MQSRIRQYIERAFADVPNTTRNSEIKESLYSDLEEKYEDLIEKGKTDEEACNEVIAGIGDLSELTHSLTREAQEQYVETARDRRRAALLVASGVGLYILCPIVYLLCESFVGELFATCMFFVTAAIATGILIFHTMTKPAAKREAEKDPDDIETWASAKVRHLYGSLTGALWVLTVAAYITINFATGLWHISWVIFLVATVVQLVLKAIFVSKYRE